MLYFHNNSQEMQKFATLQRNAFSFWPGLRPPPDPLTRSLPLDPVGGIAPDPPTSPQCLSFPPNLGLTCRVYLFCSYSLRFRTPVFLTFCVRPSCMRLNSPSFLSIALCNSRSFVSLSQILRFVFRSVQMTRRIFRISYPISLLILFFFL